MYLFQLNPTFRSALFNLALLLVNDVKRPQEAIPYLNTLLKVWLFPCRTVFIGGTRYSPVKSCFEAQWDEESISIVGTFHFQN